MKQTITLTMDELVSILEAVMEYNGKEPPFSILFLDENNISLGNLTVLVTCNPDAPLLVKTVKDDKEHTGVNSVMFPEIKLTPQHMGLDEHGNPRFKPKESNRK